jgi:hypothetical protein
MFARAFAAESMHTFCRRLVDNVIRLMTETSADQFVVPTAVFLVLDQAHGGDATAEEIQRRFRFLDVESRDVIDFPCSDGRVRPTAPSHSISRRFRAAATICCGQACASSVATPIS